jgi:hypothetical protein
MKRLFTFVWKSFLVLLAVAIIALVAYELGGMNSPTLVPTIQTVTKTVEADAPVLFRIGYCESKNLQFKNGELNYHINVKKNGERSLDVGKFMINMETWGATASKMGLDLTKEVDNETFAKWLYHNKGTGDWEASAYCWKR